MKTAAIIAAAGVGRRMGGSKPKQYLTLNGRPIICHTLDRFIAAGVDQVVIVVEPGREPSFRTEILISFDYPSSWKVVAGGDVRQKSVFNGLKAVSEDIEVILVHDGVRPFITDVEIRKLAAIAFDKGACILAHPIKETIKKVGSDNSIIATIDRRGLWGAQTPQAFRRSLLMEAMEAAFAESFIGTDEASVVERMGKKVEILEGDIRNIKITTPSDLVVAEAILKNWTIDH